jgi:hypothetical protein
VKIYYTLKIMKQGQVGYLALCGPGSLAPAIAQAFGHPVGDKEPEAAWLWVPSISGALLFPERSLAQIICDFAGEDVSVVSVKHK